eukprot:COSAG06_NODE_47556_length_338_cov_1.075314_1_plen_54_part_10
MMLAQSTNGRSRVAGPSLWFERQCLWGGGDAVINAGRGFHLNLFSSQGELWHAN